jgi:hypothetical protein
MVQKSVARTDHLGSIRAGFAAGLILAVSLMGCEAITSRPPPVPSSTAAAAAPAPALQWQPVAGWQGVGDHTTESFRITAQQWRITASARPPYRTDRGVCVDARRAPIQDVGGGCAADSQTEYAAAGPGVYYLSVDTDNGWVVTIEELR